MSDSDNKNGASNGVAARIDESDAAPESGNGQRLVLTKPSEHRREQKRRRIVVARGAEASTDSEQPTEPPPAAEEKTEAPQAELEDNVSDAQVEPRADPEDELTTGLDEPLEPASLMQDTAAESAPEPATLTDYMAKRQRGKGTLDPPAPPARRRADDDEEPSRVEDLCDTIDFNDNYISVDRKQPTMFEGRMCNGAMKPIDRRMTHAEFGKRYGGGKYDLRVYRRNDDKTDGAGRAVYRPVGKVMRVIIPVPPVPNVMAGISATEDDEAEPPGKRTLGQASNADARMHEANLAHEREKRMYEDQRAEREEQKREVRAREHERRSKEETHSQLSFIDKAQERLQEQLDKKDAELERMREKYESANNNVKTDADKAAAMMTSMGATMQAMMAPLVATLATKKENGPDLQAVLNEERRRADERIRDAEIRSGENIKRIEEQCAARILSIETHCKERIASVEQRAKDDVEAAKRDADRRISDNDARHTERVADIERQHQAELRSKDTTSEMKLNTEKATIEAKIESLKSESRRLQQELDRARQEANKPIGKRLAEITEAAEAIGLSRGGSDEPADWKTMLMQTAMNIGSQLPELLKSAGDAVRAVRSAPLPAATAAMQEQQLLSMQQAASHQAAQMRPRFATEDGPLFEATHTPPLISPEAQPSIAAVVPPPAPPPPMQPLVPPVPVGPVSTPPQAGPSITPNPEPGASIPPATGAEIPDAQILAFREMFEAAFKANANPAEVAQHLIGQVGVPTMTNLLTMVDPQRINAALQRGGYSTSPLVRRDGQKYLRAIWSNLRKLCQLS